MAGQDSGSTSSDQGTAGVPLSVRDLSKAFGPLTAVDGLSFEVRRGECFGLLGPNGAGKTTTLSVVCSLVRPDSGQVLVAGIDVASEPVAARRALGLVPQDVSVYEELTARENLHFFGSLYGLSGRGLRERAEGALRLAGLEDRAGDRVESFSGGMKRRLNLAVGLVHDPSLLLLDEPTVGVDPQSRNHLFETISELKRRGITIVYTTHYMEEAERLCDRVAIMDRGRLVALGTREELMRRIGATDRVELEFAGDGPPAPELLRTVFAGLAFTQRGGGVTIPAPDGARSVPGLLERCKGADLPVRAVTLRPPDLEAVFLALTGRALRD